MEGGGLHIPTLYLVSVYASEISTVNWSIFQQRLNPGMFSLKSQKTPKRNKRRRGNTHTDTHTPPKKEHQQNNPSPHSIWFSAGLWSCNGSWKSPESTRSVSRMEGWGEGSFLALLKYQVRWAVQNTAALHFLHLCWMAPVPNFLRHSVESSKFLGRNKALKFSGGSEVNTHLVSYGFNFLIFFFLTVCDVNQTINIYITFMDWAQIVNLII